MLALVALEFQAQRLFERGADSRQRGKLHALDARLGVAGVRSKEPSHILGRGEGRGVEHDSLKELDEAVASLLIGLARECRRRPESAFRCPPGGRFRA